MPFIVNDQTSEIPSLAMAAVRHRATGVLEYHRKPVRRRASWIPAAIEISGGLVFFIGGVGVICTFLSDSRFFRMSAGDILQGLLFIMLPLLFGGAACVCGNALRRGALWASPATAVVLLAIVVLLLALLSIILYGLAFNPYAIPVWTRLLELAIVLLPLSFYSLTLAWLVRDDVYPRWKNERTYW